MSEARLERACQGARGERARERQEAQGKRGRERLRGSSKDGAQGGSCATGWQWEWVCGVQGEAGGRAWAGAAGVAGAEVGVARTKSRGACRYGCRHLVRRHAAALRGSEAAHRGVTCHGKQR